MTEKEPIRGDEAVKILKTREVSTEFLLVDANELAAALSPWFIRKEDKEKIVAPLLQTGEKKGAASKLLDVIVDHFKQGREDISLQDFITTLEKTEKYHNLIIALLEAGGLPKGPSAPGHVIDKAKSNIITNLAEYYKKRFAVYSPYPHMDPFSIERVWVNLSLSKGRSKLSGDYLNMLKEAYDGPQLSMLIGHPGEGKTMTMRRIAYDWATGKLKDYDLVLAVPLREIIEKKEKSKTILDMTLAYMQRRNVLKEADVNYLKAIRNSMVGQPKMEEEPSNQLHVLIILDGYDEFNSDVQCQELNELLFGQVFQNLDYCVLVTSRPYAVEDVSAPVSALKIEPLDEEQQRTYMFQHFEQELPNADPSDRMTRLKNLLSENPGLQEPAKTPLLLCFICILIDVLTPTDDDVQLYKLLFNAMVERYESKVSTPRSTEREENNIHGLFKEPFQNICGKSDMFFNLGQMALSGLVGDTGHAPDKLQFTEEDLKKFGIDGDYCIKVGFLNFQLQGRLNEKIYEFPHKTMQEFFAALLLFHELSKCEEIEVYREDENDSTCPKIKNIDRHFRRHPLLKQVFNTTKYDELDQLFSFLLEMSADSNKDHFTHPFPLHVVPLPLPFFNPIDYLLVTSQYIFRRLTLTGSQETQTRRMSNTINFFLAWTGRNRNRRYATGQSMFRPILKHLSNCSEEAKNYMRQHDLLITFCTASLKSLLWHFSTCNVYMFRVDNVCIYVPDLHIIFIVDQTLIDRIVLSHSIPIPYEQLKTKCNSTFKLCLIDSAALQNLHQACKGIDCKKIEEVTINISSAINQSSILSLEQKLQVDYVNIIFDKTIESPFDITPVWSCISLFTNIKVIRIGSLRENNLIGLDQIFRQTEIRNSVERIHLTFITFPNEETVRLLAEQLKQLKSLHTFSIHSSPSQSIGEQYLFMLLDSVEEDRVPYLDYLDIDDSCLEQRETFKKLCSHFEQWDHLRRLRLDGFLLSDIDLLCNIVSNLSHLEKLEVLNLNQRDVNRLEEAKANPELIVENTRFR